MNQVKRHIKLIITISIGLFIGTHGKISKGQCSKYESSKLVATDFVAQFGYSVDIDGDVAVVGTPWDEDNGNWSGSAYVYRFNGEIWIEETKLLASDGQQSDDFGRCVKISGNTIVIGAPGDDDDGSSSGSIYVYKYDGANWIEQPKIKPLDGAPDKSFGSPLALDNDILAVGIEDDEENGRFAGAAYIFRDNGTNWQQELKIIPDDNEAYDYFGRSIAVYDKTIVIGADNDKNNSVHTGSAYVYHDNGSNWIMQDKIVPPGNPADTKFGRSCAIFSDKIVIGAESDDENGNYSGAVYAFRNNGSSWILHEKITAYDGHADDRFGYSLAFDDDFLMVGVRYKDDIINGVNSGSAYLYKFDGTNWTIQAQLFASDGAENDYFGVSVGLSGEKAIVGSFLDDGNYTGSAYTFYLPRNDLDDDGVADICDECPATIGGLRVDDRGCALPIPGDLDNDYDVDQEDFGHFQICMTGDGIAQIEENCQIADLDNDLDVDQSDVTIIQNCMSGPNNMADAYCAD